MKISFKSLLFTLFALLTVSQMTFAQERNEEHKALALTYAHHFANDLVKILADINEYEHYTIKDILIPETTHYKDKNELDAYVEILWSPYGNETVYIVVGGLTIFLDTKKYEYRGACDSFDGRIGIDGDPSKPAEILVSEVAAIETSTPGVPMPSFPWPPPKASAQEELPNHFFKDCTNLMEANEVLDEALKKSGYLECSYFTVPHGFALVTRIEQINKDGSPKNDPNRWELSSTSPSRFSLSEYFIALFTAPKGFFRVIGFIITDQAFAQSPESVTRDDAIHWLSKGFNRLPKTFKGIPFTEDYRCTALIYEFATLGNSEPVFADPSIHLGRTHLEKSQLWEFLNDFRE